MPRNKSAPNAAAGPSTGPTRTSTKAKPVSSNTLLTSQHKQASNKRARTDSDGEEVMSATKKVKDDGNNQDQAQDISRAAVTESKKTVTPLKRRAAPVDPMSHLVGSHQVYADAEEILDARLNQTEISGNKNKFYILQLLHPIGNSGACQLFTRWGRVGENGQCQLKGPWNPATAVNEFKKQFKAKAGVDWVNKNGMTARKGKYLWLEPAEDDEDGAEERDGEDGEGCGCKEERVPDSALASELQELCQLIFSTKLEFCTYILFHYTDAPSGLWMLPWNLCSMTPTSFPLES